MNNAAKLTKLSSFWGKLKQHKLITVVAFAAAAVIILWLIFSIPKTYKIGQKIKGRDLIAEVLSIEYTDNVAEQIKPYDGYIFVIIEVSLTNKSRNEQSVAFRNFMYQNEHSALVSAYLHASSFSNYYALFGSKCLLQGESIRGVIVYQVSKEVKEHTLYFKEYDGADEVISSFRIILPDPI